MVSIMKHVYRIVMNNQGMRLVNHFPTTRTPYEGDPEKAAEESRKDEKERDGVQRADGLKSVRGRSILS